jgi:hypothetical protein
MKRRYTMEQYRADVTRLYALRRSDAPGLSAVLTDALSADAELVAMELEEPPPMSAVQKRHLTTGDEETLRISRGSGLHPRAGRASR